MKAVLKLLFLPLALIVLLTQCEKEPGHVNIPDNAFLNALIELGVDANGDWKISPAEAEIVLSLNVRRKNISDMTGIEAFVNLKILNCDYNEIGSLDISNNTALEALVCEVNQLTTLDVSNNTALTDLDCRLNQLTSLDVSNNPALTELACSNNQLTSLDVSNNPALTGLGCFNNQLTSLDVSNNTALESLWCGENQLTSLDISKNTALGWLYLRDMPSLYEVCVWTMPFPPEDVEVDISGSPNVYFTTECSE